MSHAGDVFGHALVIHGGLNGEDKEILGDVRIFDLER